MKKIIEASELPEGDKVYMKKDMFGWRIVHPYRNPDTNKIIPINLIFGGKRNLVVLLVILAFILSMIYIFKHDIRELEAHYQDVLANPCDFCLDNIKASRTSLEPTYINFSIKKDGAEKT